MGSKSSNQINQMTDKDKINMESFLEHIFESFESGVLTKDRAIAGICQVILAVDRGDYAETEHWLERGRRLVQMTANSKGVDIRSGSCPGQFPGENQTVVFWPCAMVDDPLGIQGLFKYGEFWSTDIADRWSKNEVLRWAPISK